MVIFEYLAHSGTKSVWCCIAVIIRASTYYWFVDGCAERYAIKWEQSGKSRVFRRMWKTYLIRFIHLVLMCSRQIDSIPEYTDIRWLQINHHWQVKETFVILRNRYSLSGSKQQLKFLSNLTQVTINQNNVVSNFKTMLIEAYLDNEKIKTKPTSTADWLATINDVKALTKPSIGKAEDYLGIQLKNVVLASFNALHATPVGIGTMWWTDEQQISSIEHEIYAVKNKGNETVRTPNNQIVQVKELIAVKESLQVTLNRQFMILKSRKDVIKDMNISVMEQEYKRTRALLQRDWRSEEIQTVFDWKLRKYQPRVRQAFSRFASWEMNIPAEALNAESNQVQEAMNQLRNRFDLKVKELSANRLNSSKFLIKKFPVNVKGFWISSQQLWSACTNQHCLRMKKTYSYSASSWLMKSKRIPCLQSLTNWKRLKQA